MTNTTFELYDALITAGVDKAKAEKAAKAVLSRSEAANLADKADVSGILAKIDQTRAELFKFMAVQTLAIIAGVVGLLQDLG